MQGGRVPNFYEFFAGGGMARAGLGEGWTCTFANDFDPMKAETYRNNWGRGHLVEGDVARLTASQLPGQAALAWASFPCQDLSLAGASAGLGEAFDTRRTRSGTFWPFWNLISQLGSDDRAPQIIALENVWGILRSNSGKDFKAICEALSSQGYRFGALVLDAKLFLPQSRPRVFIFGVRSELPISHHLMSGQPLMEWHPAALREAVALLGPELAQNWIWWNLPQPKESTLKFSDIVRENPEGVRWHSQDETHYLLNMMSVRNLAKVEASKRQNSRVVGAIYKRTRVENGLRVQRAEVRFDEVAGCLRTPGGGSSRQTIIVVEGERIRTRLLAPREAADLMGLPPDYRLPSRYNDAYHVAGDGVAVPAVKFLRDSLFDKLLAGWQGDSIIPAVAAE